MEKMPKEIIDISLAWDIINWGKSLNFFEKYIDYNKPIKALELGAGFRGGGYSHYFTMKNMNVICSDYPVVSKLIKEIHRKYNLDKVITYQTIDALDIPYKEEFDIIFFKSLLGGIG